MPMLPADLWREGACSPRCAAHLYAAHQSRGLLQRSQTSDLCISLQGFRSVYKPQRSGTVQFAELLDAVAQVDPEMRIRFTSPHPKDFSDDVLQVSPVEHCSECLSLGLAACEG